MTSSSKCGTRAGRSYHVRVGEPVCEACREAHRLYEVNRRRAIAYGTWNPLHSSAHVRAHLMHLQRQGMGWRTIADRAGVARSVVARLLRYDTSKPAARVRAETAEKLLAVTIDQIADGTLVDILGTTRRLQALIAIGHMQKDLAERIGWTVFNIGGLVHARQTGVTAGTARAVATMFEELSAVPGPSVRSRELARRKGWAPPLAWDEGTIDNPDARPEGVRTSNKPTPATDVEELLEMGFTIDQIAARLGIRPSSVTRRLERATA